MTAGRLPDGYHSVTPYLLVEGADRVIEFLRRAFDAEEVARVTGTDGRILNAEVRIGDSMVMLAEARGGQQLPGAIYLYVTDTDEAYRRALEAGGVPVMEPADQYYGDRNAGVRDVGGNTWWIATRIEDVPPEEIQRRALEKEQRGAG